MCSKSWWNALKFVVVAWQTLEKFKRSVLLYFFFISFSAFFTKAGKFNLSLSIRLPHSLPLIVSLKCGGGRVTPLLLPSSLPGRYSSLSPQSRRQHFNKAGMNLALSALFSFLCAAGNVTCASPIFMEEPGSSLCSQTPREKERWGSGEGREKDGFFKCHTYENDSPTFPLHNLHRGFL